MKAFFIIFKRFLVAKNCLRPQSAPLRKEFIDSNNLSYVAFIKAKINMSKKANSFQELFKYFKTRASDVNLAIFYFCVTLAMERKEKLILVTFQKRILATFGSQ